MASRVCILDAQYTIKTIINNITDEAILAIVNTSKVLDLKCLSFIYISGDTFFNREQVLYIKKEVELLRRSNYPEYIILEVKKALDIIQEGVDIVTEHNDLYLQFLGD